MMRSFIITKMVKSWRMSWAENVACLGTKGNTCRISAGITEGKKH
jgi:hypothetical protein